MPNSSFTRFHHLDMLRGCAALLVCIGHIRGFVLINYGHLDAPTILETSFYAVTSLGHQAVIIFFALSGFLVGGQVFDGIRQQHWNVLSYLIRRLCRLWIVAVPALALTFFWDSVGMLGPGSIGYDGVWQNDLASGPSVNQPVDHTLTTLLANIFFLQTITVPIFGNNGPMWSLANEFWYYLLFPALVYSAIGGGTNLKRILALAIGALIIWLLPYQILALGFIWLFGALSMVWRKVIVAIIPPAAMVIFVSTSFLSALIYSMVSRGLMSDLVLGSVCAISLPFLCTLPSFGRHYERLSSVLSEMSYTLYVVHFPILAAICFNFIGPNKQILSGSTAALMTILLAGSMLYAFVIWWCFERNTVRLRRWIEHIFLIQSENKKVKTD